ncbi:MAG: DUF2007 domain-containing protein [Flavobacteriales bacterium]|nr:DUF2007 domain-containing protein [Flavobacteriales bacterium]
MEQNWVKVYSSVNIIEAELKANLLREKDIPVSCINKQDSMHIHLNTFTPVEIYVPKDFAFKAVQLLSKEVGLE